MSLASTVETIGGSLKTFYSSEPAQKQFFNDLIVLKRIEQRRKELIGAGGSFTYGLHVGRNPGIGAAANGAATPANGKQTYSQTTGYLKYVYGATQFTGPDIVNSSSNKGAFASVMTANMNGMIDDMQADVNRQLFADGTGILAFAAGADDATPATIYPYLWDTAGKYLQTASTRIEGYTIADGSTSVCTSAYTASTTTDSSLAWTGTISGTAAGTYFGRYGALQLADATTITQYEMMGLMGIVHNTNLFGGAGYSWDVDNLAITGNTFKGPEGQDYDAIIGSNANTLQGLSASTYSWWKSKVWGNGGVPRAISFKLLDDAIGYLKTTQNSKLTAIYTTYKVNNKIIELLRADRRYTGEKMKLDGGLMVDSYAGIPIIISNDAPRGTMLFVDENELSFVIGKDFGFLENKDSGVLQKITGYDGYECTAAIYANLMARNRHKHGKIIDILES